MSVNTPHVNHTKHLRVLKKVVANKWLTEKLEAVGDIKRHRAERGLTHSQVQSLQADFRSKLF